MLICVYTFVVLVPPVTGTCNTSQPGRKQMPFARESPKRAQALLSQTRQNSSITAENSSYHCHCCREGVLPCHYHSGRCTSLISLSLLQRKCTAMLAGVTLSYHCHCCRKGVLPCLQVPLSHIIVIAVRQEYCQASRCHSPRTHCLLQHLHSS